VERQLMESTITQLHNEIAQRDQLDASMEACVLGLMDRLKALEIENDALLKMQRQASPPPQPGTSAHDHASAGAMKEAP
jgi:hypothetical protein